MDTPVALIIFNRPDCTERVLKAIAKAKPSRLFVIADGPRPDRPDDIEKCIATRAVIDKVDWECEVITDYSDINLGCKMRPVSGIDRVFEQVEEAIILEDDCLPDPSFFPFCEELLERYRHDERVMMIGGINFLGNFQTTYQSYYFSLFGGTWGWATWRRAWKLNDPDMKLWPQVQEMGILEKIFPIPEQCNYWKGYFQKVYDGTITDAWDYQWLLSCWINSGYRVFPEVNLVSNIGFREDATHTFGESPLANMETAGIAFPLKHPQFIFRSIEADEKIQESFSGKRKKDYETGEINETNGKLIRSGLSAVLNRLENFRLFRLFRHPSSPPPTQTEADRMIAFVRSNTMLPHARLHSLYEQAVYCETNGIMGDYVECGTWKGGAVGLMLQVNQKYSASRRHVHLFDSFEGIPEPEAGFDGEKAIREAIHAGGSGQGRLVAVTGFYDSPGTLEINRELLENRIGYDPSFLHYHKGWFQDTLPAESSQVGDIAILRLDGDWYASTKVCLEHLYSKVVTGGFIIIDDYGCYEGCRRAVDEFLESNNIHTFLHRIDSEGRYWIKG